MRPIRIPVAAAADMGVVPVDANINPTSISVALVPGAGADLTVQFTFDDIHVPGYNPATGNWFPHPNMTGVAALQAGTIVQPVTGVRTIRNGGDAGNAYEFILLQAGIA